MPLLTNYQNSILESFRQHDFPGTARIIKLKGIEESLEVEAILEICTKIGWYLAIEADT
jgi:hypothetical protein